MIEEESQFPMDSVFLVIMMIALFVVIAFSVWMFFDIEADIEIRTLDRAGVEVSDALVKSPLTEELAIFKKEELDKYDGTRIEPYIQHCQFGYKLEFKTENNRWEFGYSPDIDNQADSESRYPVAIVSSNRIEPAELKVKIYDSWTTRITCLIEGAHRSGETTSTATFNCPDDLRDHYNLCGFEIRRMNNDPDSDFVCIYSSEDDEDKDCRYMPDINILKQRAFYSGSKNNDVRILRAIPVKRNLAPSVINSECPEIKETMKAVLGEDAVIVLCFEPKEE